MEDGSRTRTAFSQWILSPSRLPVPSQPHFWYSERDLNSYAIKRRLLRPLCLPIPPSEHIALPKNVVILNQLLHFIKEVSFIKFKSYKSYKSHKSDNIFFFLLSFKNFYFGIPNQDWTDTSTLRGLRLNHLSIGIFGLDSRIRTCAGLPSPSWSQIRRATKLHHI